MSVDHASAVAAPKSDPVFLPGNLEAAAAGSAPKEALQALDTHLAEGSGLGS